MPDSNEDVQVGAAAVTKVPRSKSIATRKRNAHDLILEAKTLKNDKERVCNGTVKVRDEAGNVIHNADGSVRRRPCKAKAIKGGTVCCKHGGAAPQVKRKAQKRLLAMVEPSLIRLEALVQQEQHLPTALGAIKTVLERAGTDMPMGPLAKDNSGERDMRPVINIGIAVGGITRKVAVDPAAMPAAAIEGDVEE
jgi:hypothetical protein